MRCDSALYSRAILLNHLIVPHGNKHLSSILARDAPLALIIEASRWRYYCASIPAFDPSQVFAYVDHLQFT